MKRGSATAIAAILIALALVSSARAWDSATHRLIARVAVASMPQSPAQEFFESNIRLLQQYSTDPDTKLRDLYGKAEARRHYIDLEVYGPNPWAELLPDRLAMEKKVGIPTLDRSGTLPWTIEEVANTSERAWLAGNCGEVLRQSGYLAHYIGDASQPLHSTVHFDGYDASDRGVHLRIENAVDDESRELYRPVKQDVSVQPVIGIWNTTIAEIRDANTQVKPLIDADRYARQQSHGDKDRYREILMQQQGDMITHQLARAASVLAAVWHFEWQRAGSPKVCSGGFGFVPIEGPSAVRLAGIPSQ
jgi:Zinc dependent phospholipase C